MIFPILEQEMFKNKITNVMIAKKLGHKTSKTFSNKKLGKTEFTREEMLTIRNEFFPKYSLEELFKKNESMSSRQTVNIDPCHD